MSDEPLEERLAAVERALGDGDGATPAQPTDDVADRLDALEDDVADLEAAVQALRGYVGSVKHVNDEVERRADAAMAKAEAVERQLEGRRTDGRPTVDGEHRGDKEPVDGDRGGVAGSTDTDPPGQDHCPRCAGERAPRGAGRGSPAGSHGGRATNVADRRVVDSGVAGPCVGNSGVGDSGVGDSGVADRGSGSPADGGTATARRTDGRAGEPAGEPVSETDRPHRGPPATDGRGVPRADADGDAPGRQPPDPRGAEVGHRRLEDPEDDDDGLLARLRAVV
jgi:hypothetical protein